MLGIALAALPFVLAVSWASQHRMLGRFVACLVVGLGCGALFALLFALAGQRLTYDPAASSTLGNWSGLGGLLVGMVVGWVAGTVTGPALLLRVRGFRLDGARVMVGVLAGFGLSGVLVYMMEALDSSAPGPLVGLSSAATFAAFTMAARERQAA